MGSLGERIAAYRRRRGLGQATVAGLVGRSESWLSQVERGLRSVDRLSVLLDLARVLNVDVEALLGRPLGVRAERRSRRGRAAARAKALRPLVTLAELRAQVAGAHETYQAAQYRQALLVLPGLLRVADARQRSSAGPDRQEWLRAYVSAYVVAAKLLTKLGVTDLAMVAADRSATVSLDAASRSARGLADYQVASALLRADRVEDAEHLSVAMAEQLQAAARADQPVRLSVAGALWLLAAVVAARRAERYEAQQRLHRAQMLADLLGEDGNHGWTAFGPTNVAIHRVSVAAELGDAGDALDAATAIDAERLPAGLQSRRAQMHLDLAWAQSQRKRDAEAVLHLLEAERVAPQAVHYNVIVRELVRELLSRQSRVRTSALHDLAVRAGVLT